MVDSRSEKITISRPNQRHELGWLHTWHVMFMNVIESRELIWQLFKRDFLASYKKSFIGFTWIFITPLLGVASWVFMKQIGVLKPGDVGIPYPAYILIGTTMWGLFIKLYSASAQTLIVGKALVMQVNYPHEALLFKQAAQQLASFVIAFALNMVVLLFFKVTPSWGTLLLPFVAFPLFLAAAGIGLIVSMFSVVAVDLSRIISALMGLLMYLTPIIYSRKIPNALVREAIKWNPLTYLVCSCRDIVVYGRLYDPVGYAICSALSVGLFLVAWRLFYTSEHRIIERMV